ncbi:hypothetical protein Rhe02_56860 [Rhizocola hellebori]|uniref:Uncharacterized protein n=1 Tax=Rhizocola hellebori TaxID=1392758 RepID=A0A8J3QB99_9ACTN|nr:hypothetical protein Rhe02_56860 [Rhizocola hellebori]
MQIVFGSIELAQLARTTPELLRTFPGVEHLKAVDELNGSARSLIVLSAITVVGAAIILRPVHLGRLWARRGAFAVLSVALGLELLQIGGDSSAVVQVGMLVSGSSPDTADTVSDLLYPAWLPWGYFTAEIIFVAAGATALVCLLKSLSGEYFERKNATSAADDPRLWDVKAIRAKMNPEND